MSAVIGAVALGIIDIGPIKVRRWGVTHRYNQYKLQEAIVAMRSRKVLNKNRATVSRLKRKYDLRKI